MVSWIRQVAAEVIRSSQILDIFEDTAYRIPYRLDLDYEGEKREIRDDKVFGLEYKKNEITTIRN